MRIVLLILSLFVIGWLIAGLCRYSWHRANLPPKKERDMTRKVKFAGAKSRTKEIVHLDYLRVYHELLKYEEVMDIELDVIYDAVVGNLQRKLAKGKLCDVPDSVEIEIIIKEVMDKLVGVQQKKAS
jgi:hypothetical protein